MCDITANKHQRQECLAGDEKSGPVMRGYEPFLSVEFCNEKPGAAAAAHAEQPVPKALGQHGDVQWAAAGMGTLAPCM